MLALKQHPNKDLIINFSAGSQFDILNFEDLLSGVTEANIADYMTITITEDESLPTGGLKEGDTTININVDGNNPPKLKIILQRWSLADWQDKYHDNTLTAATLIRGIL